MQCPQVSKKKANPHKQKKDRNAMQRKSRKKAKAVAAVEVESSLRGKRSQHFSLSTLLRMQVKALAKARKQARKPLCTIKVAGTRIPPQLRRKSHKKARRGFHW